MTSKTRKKVDPAARKAELDQLHAQFAAQVEELRGSATWTRYLQAVSRFHRYSFRNMVLIFAQCPEATQVAGYRAWLAKGRQVRKGTKSIRILAPCPFTVEDKDEATGETVETTRLRFKPTSVFDISQTDVREGYEDVWSAGGVDVEGDDAGVFARVRDWLEKERGVVVTVEPLSGGVKGYTTPANEKAGTPIRVVIDGNTPAATQAATIVHEAAHIVLGHVEGDHAEYRAHRGRYEVEAESVAYVVAGLMGLDTSATSTGYVAGWMESAEADVLQETAARVLAAAHEVIEGVEPTAQADEVAA